MEQWTVRSVEQWAIGFFRGSDCRLCGTMCCRLCAAVVCRLCGAVGCGLYAAVDYMLFKGGDCRLCEAVGCRQRPVKHRLYDVIE